MNKKTLSVLLILCMLLTMVPVTALAGDVVGAEPAAAAIGENDVASINGVGFANLQAAITTSSAATIVLEKNTAEDVTIPAGKTITLDLNGKTLTGKVVVDGSNLTIQDSTAATAPTVDGNYDVTYTAGKIVATGTTILAQKGGTATLKSGIVESTGNIGVLAGTNGNVIVNGGYINTPEFSASAQGTGATLTINDGVLVAKDNAVVAGNGTVGLGDTTININGGTMIGNIKTSGYIACGVYHPQKGTLNITGGTFIVNGGAGVLMRGGTLNMTGGTINASGNTAGWVGDKKSNVDGGVIADVASNYYDAANIKINISGGCVTDDTAVKLYGGAEGTRYFELSGGTYSSEPVAEYVAAGYAVDKNTDSTYTVNKIEATDVEEDIVVDAPKVEVDAFLTEDEKTAVTNAVATVTETTDALASAAETNVDVTDETKVAAAKKLAEAGITVADTDTTVTVVVSPYFNIQVKDYNAATTATESVLKLDITPMYVLKATIDPENMVEEKQDETGVNVNTVTLGNPQPLNVKDAVIISLNLPDGFTANVVKHQKDAAEGGAVYYYDLTTGTDNKASFTVTHGFSEFTLMTVENNTATINFNQNVGKKEYKITNVNDALPTVSGNFIGWKINGETYTTLTEELWNAIAGKEVDAVAQFSSSGSSSGGSSSGGGAAIANKVTVTTPDSDVNVSHSAVSSSVINDVKDAVADDKNVQVVGGSSNTVNITAKQDGNTLTSFDNPLTVTVPVSSNVLANVKDTSKLTLAQVTKDANGEIVLTYVGGNYNADKKTFTAYVDEPGDYVLLADANVQKIELQIGDKASAVNGRTIMNDVAPIIVNDRTMIPLRFVSEALGAQVEWNEAARTVTIKQDGVTMRMTIDKMIDGFNAAPIIRNSRTMVPVRYIAERLGANVIYVPITQEIIVVR